jgi:hypothetical protein
MSIKDNVTKQKRQDGSRKFLHANKNAKTMSGRLCIRTTTPRRRQDVFAHEQRLQDDVRTSLHTNNDPKTASGRFCTQTTTPGREQDVFVL